MTLSSLQRVTQLINKLILSAFSLISFVASANVLQPFEAEFKAYKYDRALGKASLSLESIGDNQYKLIFASKLSLFLVSDKRREESTFRFIEGSIRPEAYTFKRTGFGKDRQLDANFDEAQKLIRFENKPDIPWQQEFDNQLYRLDLQLKLRSQVKQFEYDLVNYRGEKRHYALLVLGKEQLSLPYGMLEGIKVKIMRESKKRETYAWFAPSLNYQLVRLQQFKEGKEQGDIRLSAFRYTTDTEETLASSQ